MVQLRNSLDHELKPILFWLHRSTSHQATLSRLTKHKMAKDNAEFSIYQRYKKDFEIEVQFIGPEFALPPKKTAAIFADGLRPVTLKETVRNLQPSDLADADRYARQLLPQEQAFAARTAREKQSSTESSKLGESSQKSEPAVRFQTPPGPNSKTSKQKAARAAAAAANGENPAAAPPWVPTCYNCGEKGHIKPDCPELGERTQRTVEPDKKYPFKPPGVSVAKSPSKKSVNSVRGREEKADEETDHKRIMALNAEREESNRSYEEDDWHDRPSVGNRRS